MNSLAAAWVQYPWAGWLVKMDAKTGKFLGYVAVEEKTCLHSVDVDGDGFPMTDVGNRVVRYRLLKTTMR